METLPFQSQAKVYQFISLTKVTIFGLPQTEELNTREVILLLIVLQTNTGVPGVFQRWVRKTESLRLSTSSVLQERKLSLTLATQWVQ